jgi:peptidoglycan/LPS O-acetylase OafA/YrhL
MNGRTRRIPTLDGWRGVAIIGVIWYHAMDYFFINKDIPYVSLARFGRFGVDIFFGLSGMLITGLLLEQMGQTSTISLKAFYTRRAFRILPIYLLFIGVLVVMGLMHGPRELASCLLFLRNYVPGDWSWRNTAHLWTLSIEEHFYLIWPVLLLICGVKLGRHVAAYFAIAVGFWKLLESQLNLHLFPGVPPLIRTDLRIDALLWGAVVAFTLNDENAREKLRLQLQFWPWLGMVAAALFSMVYYSALTSVFFAVMIPMILAGTLLHPEWLVSKLLDSAPIAQVGRISYSLYIWQNLFLMPGFEHPSHFATRLPWNLAVVFVVACASYYLVETPLLRVGGRFAAKFTAPLTPCSVTPGFLERTDTKPVYSGNVPS